jgi:DNA-binding transcriptional ArsR family regulator
MAGKVLNDKTLELIAERFRLLGDPVRLRLLQTLEAGEMSVADLVASTGAAQASVSKHLQLLLRGGLVRRRRQGMFVHYSVVDDRVFELCDVVCGSLTAYLARELEQLGGRPGAPDQGPADDG